MAEDEALQEGGGLLIGVFTVCMLHVTITLFSEQQMTLPKIRAPQENAQYCQEPT